ncbi:hypothetical protein EG877_16830, partial [Enterococcus faecalis]
RALGAARAAAARGLHARGRPAAAGDPLPGDDGGPAAGDGPPGPAVHLHHHGRRPRGPGHRGGAVRPAELPQPGRPVPVRRVGDAHPARDPDPRAAARAGRGGRRVRPG